MVCNYDAHRRRRLEEPTVNKNRRQRIAAIRQRITALLETAETIKTDLEAIRDEEQAAIDALDGVMQDLESLTDNDFDGPLTEAAA